MPSVARKVIVCAAADGLILQPQQSKKDQGTLPLTRIEYGNAKISNKSRDSSADLTKSNSSFEAFGIVGLITVFRYSYLVSITRRQQVAQIRGLPVYVVTEVAITPCSSEKEANESIAQTSISLSTTAGGEHEGESSSKDDVSAALPGDDEVVDEGPEAGGDPPWSTVTTPNSTARSSLACRSTVAEDVINRRGSYGRFAQRWFSRSGWTMDQQRTMGLSTEAKAERPKQSEGVANIFSLPENATQSIAAVGLLPKLLRTAHILLGSSRTFYFSYDMDITRSANNAKLPATALFPLYNHVDPAFFWNRSILQPFIESGMDAIALPLMQGFIGQRCFVMDSRVPLIDDKARPGVYVGNSAPQAGLSDTPSDGEAANATEKLFDITLISRRSTKRAGLRYLRRGVDEAGNVANFVETEQILSPRDANWKPEARMCSFIQIRGSFPLFFTQSPYSLKPAAVIQHSDDANETALKRHFEKLGRRYGTLQVVSLVEKHGTEAKIGERYRSSVNKVNQENCSDEAKVAFEWFDFHAVCRGMRFENVSQLLETLGPKLKSLGSTITANGQIESRQSGVFRTNCMDCLDRTNVCQGSFAKYMLELQLKEQGFDMSAQKDQVNAWFNTLWADHGDAISKQYASTGALKGDYTRTKKRNYLGALTDAGLSLTRLFNGMFNDFFLQTTIDFLLGNVTSLVFEEFEANMMTKDPAVSMQRMREQAVELCQKQVIADESEEFVGGWTLLAPTIPDAIKSPSFEEVVFLLTDVALYVVRFDWNLDKVSSFERVELAHVLKIRYGTYITSTISPAQADEVRNVGIVIEYHPGSADVTRYITPSLSSSGNKPAREADKPDASAQNEAMSKGIVGLLTRRPQTTGPRKIALKAPYSQSSLANPAAKTTKGGERNDGDTGLDEMQQIVLIVAEIERLAIRKQRRLVDQSRDDAKLVHEADIISLAEAKRNAGILEQLGHSIKKMVWA